ncbi:DUF6006 family protein [Scytonema sp. NUACC26]|uniref:DUF6006 family protein n=1 Tax=Scytonema sp. NUACC26 TaxID=3140176 RepID=UPI0034DBE039
MKKITYLLPLLLGLCVTNVVFVCFSFTQKAEAVTKDDWVGIWNCNFDGRPVTVDFHYYWIARLGEPDSIRTEVSGLIDGNLHALMPRNFDSSIDLRTDRKDHVLTLVDQKNTPWFLMMHTWDQRYASGFSKWNGSVYGISCSRQ